jgi:prevent-host-death family protein
MAMSASKACTRLFPLIEQVNDPQEPVETVSKANTAYLVSTDEWRSLETAHLPRSPGQRRAPAAQHRRRRRRPHQSPGTDRPPARRHEKISITRDDWEDYITWSNERTILKWINRMIERLSHSLSG